MMAAIGRATMTLAVHCLGDQRGEWARAMQAEFEIATEHGKPLSFAISCLAGALREMPAHEEGRFVIANHVLAIGLILPVAVMMLSTMMSVFGQSAAQYLMPDGSGSKPLLSDGNRSAIPSLLVTLSLVGAAHLRMAWALLECDWARVASIGRMLAALSVTLALFCALVFVSSSGLMVGAAVAMELGAVLVIARWHARFALGGASLNRMP
jgi:hypothetical protein